MSKRVQLQVPDFATVELTYDDQGEGRPVLLLHGGGGPQTVRGFAELLANEAKVRVLTPVHPGFGGTPSYPRPSSIAELAELYRALLDTLQLENVVVLGNSIGGWIGAELALLDSPRVTRLILVDAVGLYVEKRPVLDVFPLSPAELASFSFHDPSKFTFDPSTLTSAQRAVAAGDRAALARYGGGMSDNTLRRRLKDVRVPTLVLWGASDRVVDSIYGRIYADSIPKARFRLLPDTGHVPQIETPALLLENVLPALR